mgnify:CR=1 FL=1
MSDGLSSVPILVGVTTLESRICAIQFHLRSMCFNFETRDESCIKMMQAELSMCRGKGEGKARERNKGEENS